jgi:hypothetical protein
MRTSHVGLVLDIGEHNHYHDSDFYAVVWNPEKGMPEHMEYATTRGWTYPNSADIDATPETLAAYGAWREAGFHEAQKAREKARLEAEEAYRRELAALEAARQAAEALMGKEVVVTKGKERGAAGRVVWTGISRFAKRPSGRVGVQRADGGRLFVAVGAVKAVRS